MPLPWQEGSEPAWHSLNAGDARHLLGAPAPLSPQEVRDRLVQSGYNRLPVTHTVAPWPGWPGNSGIS